MPVADLETKIKISTIKDDMTSRKKMNYIRAGLGNYWTTYVEGQLLYKTNPKFQLGLHARHFASAYGPTPKPVQENSAISSNIIEGHGKYFFPKSVLSLTADYNKVNNEDSDKFRESISQLYQQFSVKTELKQIDTLSKQQYNFKANYYMFGNRYKNSENELELSGKFAYQLDKVSKLHIKADLSASNYSDSTPTSLSRNLIGIRPEYERRFLENKLSLKGGVNFVYDNDTLSTAKNMHIYPVVHIEYQALEKLIAYGGLDGGMEKNLYRTFVNQNPYTSLTPTLRHTNKQYEVYGGLKGNITNTIIFNSVMSYSSYQNLSVFVNGKSDSSKFDIYYDPGNSSLFKWKNEITFQPTQDLKLGLKATYYNYQMDTLKQAWHRPSLDVTAFASYNMFNKVWFSADVYYLSGIKAKNYTSGKIYDLNEIIDVNLSANYKYNDRFSFFMYFYNILAQNYQRYNQYQSKGVTIMAGLTFTF